MARLDMESDPGQRDAHHGCHHRAHLASLRDAVVWRETGQAMAITDYRSRSTRAWNFYGRPGLSFHIP